MLKAMLETNKVKELYKQIQNKLLTIVPEKWDKLCLYASVLEQIKNNPTGELFFYYFPKGILKKNPINGYEIPNRFAINENAYLNQIKELYELFKELWEEFVLCNQKRWYTITIIIENYKFHMEYHYRDIRELPYNQEQLHVIWEYQYLGMELENFSKRQRKWIQQYMQEQEQEKEIVEVYEEGVYKRQARKSISYEKVAPQKPMAEEEPIVNNQILAKKT